MDLQPIDIIVHLINLAVLCLLLWLILYKPVSKFLRARADGIAQQLENAQTLEAEANQLKAEYEAHLNQAEKEARQAALTITQKADLASAEIVNAAKQDAETILQTAREKAEAERRESIAALKGQIAELSISLAEEILGREVTEDDNRKTIDNFFVKER